MLILTAEHLNFMALEVSAQGGWQFREVSDSMVILIKNVLAPKSHVGLWDASTASVVIKLGKNGMPAYTIRAILLIGRKESCDIGGIVPILWRKTFLCQ